MVDVVFQNTAVMDTDNHPMHLHGHDVFVLAQGHDNYDAARDAARYNLVDPPLKNTVLVPRLGWAAVRFVADNPGACVRQGTFGRPWFLHPTTLVVCVKLETLFWFRNPSNIKKLKRYIEPKKSILLSQQFTLSVKKFDLYGFLLVYVHVHTHCFSLFFFF